MVVESGAQAYIVEARALVQSLIFQTVTIASIIRFFGRAADHFGVGQGRIDDLIESDQSLWVLLLLLLFFFLPF